MAKLQPYCNSTGQFLRGGEQKLSGFAGSLILIPQKAFFRCIVYSKVTLYRLKYTLTWVCLHLWGETEEEKDLQNIPLNKKTDHCKLALHFPIPSNAIQCEGNLTGRSSSHNLLTKIIATLHFTSCTISLLMQASK